MRGLYRVEAPAAPPFGCLVTSYSHAPGLRQGKVPARYNRPAMPRRKAPEDLSVEELRRLLIEKRRGKRRERLDHFRRTGRVVGPEPPSVGEGLGRVVETPEEERRAPTSKKRRFLDGLLLAVEV